MFSSVFWFFFIISWFCTGFGLSHLISKEFNHSGKVFLFLFIPVTLSGWFSILIYVVLFLYKADRRNNQPKRNEYLSETASQLLSKYKI